MVNLVVRSLCTILIGVLMIVLREAFMPVIVQFIGAAFIVSGVISLFNVYVLYKRGLSKGFDVFVLVTVGVAALFLGAWRAVACYGWLPACDVACYAASLAFELL